MSAIVGDGMGVGVVCGESGMDWCVVRGCVEVIKEGGGSNEWLVGMPRVGERWPGVVSLNTTSQEK